jgi:hypothetical protein
MGHPGGMQYRVSWVASTIEYRYFLLGLTLDFDCVSLLRHCHFASFPMQVSLLDWRQQQLD